MCLPLIATNCSVYVTTVAEAKKKENSLETPIGKLVQVVVVEFQRVQSQSLESFIVHRLQARPADLDVSNVGLRKVCEARGRRSRIRKLHHISFHRSVRGE